MKYSLIIPALLVLSLNSYAEEADTEMWDRVNEYSEYANECTLYLSGSYYHLEGSDKSGEQLAAEACLKFIMGYWGMVSGGIVHSVVNTHPDVRKSHRGASNVMYLRATYMMMVEKLFPEAHIEAEEEEEEKTNPTM